MATIFNTVQSDLLKYNGTEVTVLRELNEDEYDKSDVGQMYHICFFDGTETDAFEDELSTTTSENIYTYKVAILAMKLVLVFNDFKRYNNVEEIDEYERKNEKHFLVCDKSAFSEDIASYCLSVAEDIFCVYEDENFLTDISEYDWLSDRLWEQLCTDGMIFDIDDEEE